MPLVVLCPNCLSATERQAVLSDLSRDGRVVYRCLACGLLCAAPPVPPVIGQPLFQDPRSAVARTEFPE
jgi:hypothetical protein